MWEKRKRTRECEKGWERKGLRERERDMQKVKFGREHFLNKWKIIQTQKEKKHRK